MASSVRTGNVVSAGKKKSTWRAKEDPSDPSESARTAGLRYTNDANAGIRRVRCGHGFRYLSPDQKPLHDHEDLRRIRQLAIPPAWSKVWICPFADGHLQATGRDAKGRKQFRYHPQWRQIRDETKYHRMIPFGLALPSIRRQIERDLGLRGLPRKKVLAAIVRLLETTLIRVGNEEYARQNGSYGLTTLREDHLQVNGSTCRFVFRGKSGKSHTVDFADRRLAPILRRCQSLPGEELFQYIDGDGQVHHITSTDVNDYLRETTGQDFTAKDFRTWAGTVLAISTLEKFGSFETKVQGKRNVVQAIKTVAEQLGNTPAICRKCYVHPAVLDTYVDGTLLAALGRRTRGRVSGLRREEARVLGFLQRAARHSAKGRCY